MKYVLDASALLASLKEERGAEMVDAAIDASLISAVNFAEVAAGLVKHGNAPDDARAILATTGCTVLPADESLALDAGFLRPITDRAGLSLADRFCLALGRRLQVPVLTADRKWADIASDVGVTVELIR